MAINAMNGLGWFAAAVIVSLGCYQVSNQVAAQHDRVESIDRSIAKAKEDIRMLDVEFTTRANIAQLERWNGELMRLSAPRAGQIVSDKVALASLNPKVDDASRMDAGYVVVPEAVDPVDDGSAGGSKPDATSPKSAPVQKAALADASRSRPVTKAVATASKLPSEKVAMLDSKSLRDTSFSDLLRGARASGSGVDLR